MGSMNERKEVREWNIRHACAVNKIAMRSAQGIHIVMDT